MLQKKSKEILEQICRNVWSTTGSITSYLRRLWGWDEILLNLQLKAIKEIIPNPLEENITEISEFESEDGQIHKKEVIKNWTKRLDHRHQAFDALVVACTKPGYVQRINTISAQHTREEIFEEIKNQSKELRQKLTLLDKYLILQKPIRTNEVEQKGSEILVSFKPVKKVATYGKRYIIKNGKRIVIQNKIIFHRGPLSEESIYGKIKKLDFNKPLKYLFENPHLIFKDYIKNIIKERLALFNGGDVSKALRSVKNDPIYLDSEKNIELKYATCFKEEYVIKYPIQSLNKEDVNFIVDKKVKELVYQRLEENNFNIKEAFKNPLYFNEEKKIQFRTVRLLTGLSINLVKLTIIVKFFEYLL